MTDPADPTVLVLDPGTADNAHTIVLEPRLHELLNYFLRRPDLIHAKSDLLDAVWGDAEGTDAALMRAIGVLRKLLQDTSKPATYIETLSKRGYRWVAPLQIAPTVVPDKVALKLKTPVTASLATEPDSTAGAEAVISAQLRRRREKQRRLGLLSAFFVCAVSALVISLLLFFGKTNFIPSFTQQVTISAMAGREQKPLLSLDHETVYYQQQTVERQWRWIAHHLSNHRKQLQVQQFSSLGAAQWFGDQLVFQAKQQHKCSIFRIRPEQLDVEAEAWLPCRQFMAQGLAAQGDELVWLDQHIESGAPQLWRLNGQKAELQQTFSAAYRRPVAVLLDHKQVWVLLQQDDFNTSLFRVNLNTAALHKVADFPYAFHTLSGWDDKRLLLSSPAGSFIFSTEQSQLIPLQLASGAFVDQQRVADRLLATQIPRDSADLLPLQPATSGRTSTLLSASPWLSSNKTDQLLSWNAAQAALVSERSGLPQIWWFDGTKVSQLTRFSQWRQITQLLWAGTELHAVIDQQLFVVSLSDGALTPVLFQDRQLRHFAVCNKQWYWAEFGHQQWQLKTLNQQQIPIELLADSIDVRCAPDHSLLVLQQDGRMLRVWPDSGQQQALPWRLNWRQLNGNSWTTTSTGLYWLDTDGQLWQARWQQMQSERVQSPELLQVTGLYGQLDHEQLFLQLTRDPETDVVWLQPQPLQ
ncbi:MAG: winged helix-turn-helix domain-containing protein [Rheinheimera sp.]|nr:winged helix-turn-helix domain-containing protein [Rheinheimera sp.]